MNPEPYVEICGSGDKQIVMIHGFGINRKSWYDIRPMLSNDATLHMIDLIGFGESPTPADWPYTIESQAEIILAYIQKKQLKNIILIGHSYGGGVALMLCSQLAAQSCSNPVEKLILIGPAAYPQSLPFFIIVPRLPFIGDLALRFAGSRLQTKIGLAAAFYNKDVLTDERIDRYAGRLTPGKRHALIQTARHIIPKEPGRLAEKIKKIPTQTLLIYGDKERVISRKNLGRLSENLPDCSAKIINACGHVPHEEYPELTSKIISEFIRFGNTEGLNLKKEC